MFNDISDTFMKSAYDSDLQQKVQSPEINGKTSEKVETPQKSNLIKIPGFIEGGMDQSSKKYSYFLKN